jgi:23S rRNA (guanosine2251-2'-O)-methyltransferase
MPNRRPGAEGRARESLGGEQIEGVRAIRELFAAERRRVRELLVSASRRDAHDVEELVELARAQRVPVRIVDAEAFEHAATSAVPQGVLAHADPLQATPLAELLEGGGGRPLLVVFDEITDPQNFGAVLRSALGAGATGAVIARQRSARLGPSAAKAAAGAIEYLPIALVAGIPAALRECRRAGVWSVGLDGAGERVLEDLEIFTEPLALVLGSEGSGLSPLVRARCDVRARIELCEPVESLNAAAAAAVGLFTVARARRVGAPPGPAPRGRAAGPPSAVVSDGQPAATQPAAGQPGAEQPGAGQPGRGSPSTGRSRSGQPGAARRRSGHPSPGRGTARR